MKSWIRSLQIRHVDTGSCNACEQELTALSNRLYDFQRYGLDVVASPAHADALVVTGPVAAAMQIPLQRAWEMVAPPRWLIALGDCAAGCGPFEGTAHVCGGVARGLERPDVVVRGCPPSPDEILQALRSLIRGPRTPDEEPKDGNGPVGMAPDRRTEDCDPSAHQGFAPGDPGRTREA